MSEPGTRWFTPRGEEMRTEYERLAGLWFAWLPDEYDGAPDAGPQMVGQGNTETEALDDLRSRMWEREDRCPWCGCREEWVARAPGLDPSCPSCNGV